MLWLALMLTACSAPRYGSGDGAFVLTTYTNVEMGYRTVVPLRWQQIDSTQWMRAADERDLTGLIQLSLGSLTRAELEAIGKQQLDLEEFPAQEGGYESDHLTWELYEFEIFDDDVGQMRVKMGIAQGADGWYAVLVIGDPREVRKTAGYYNTLFKHVLYNFEPLE